MAATKDGFIEQVRDRMRDLLKSEDLEWARDEADELVILALECEGGYGEIIELWNQIREHAQELY